MATNNNIPKGGKPSRGTPADRRLTRNKPKPSSAQSAQPAPKKNPKKS